MATPGVGSGAAVGSVWRRVCTGSPGCRGPTRPPCGRASWRPARGAVTSHRCAARLLGLGFTKANPELTIPRGRKHRPRAALVHESTDLDRCGVRMVNGIPVTDPNRTALDLGRYLRVPSLTRAVETARRLELVTWTSLLHTLVAHARQGRHGVTHLREVVSLGIQREGITDTDSELVALTLLREHGLRPVLHHRVLAADGMLIAEIDLADPEQKTALEIDGAVHLRPEVRAKDDARDHRLRGMGWTVRRVWCEMPVLEPARFLAIARELFRTPPPQDRAAQEPGLAT